MSSVKQNINPYIQYLRAIAALFVVFHHSALHIVEQYGVDPLLGRGNILAYTGVSLFFCISGYLMSSISRRESLASFVWRRGARIYPAFFFSVLIAFSLNLIFGEDIGLHDFRAYTLLPFQVHGPLQVEWTLNYEITFYLITAVFCLSATRRFHVFFLFAWLAGILLAMYGFNYYGTSQFPTFYQLPLSAWSISFVLGGIFFYLAENERLRRMALLCGPYAALVLGLSIAFQPWLPLAPSKFFPPLLALLVASAACSEAQWRSSWLRNLGDRSYGLYLIHQVVAAWLTGLLASHVPSPTVMFILLVVVLVRAGSLVGSFDLASYSFLKRLGSRRGFDFLGQPPSQSLNPQNT